VVADRHCFGSLPGLERIEESGDPYLNLAKHFVEISECPRMMEKAQNRLQHNRQWVAEYKVDGVIFETLKFCDLWGYEVLTEEKGIMAAGIPIVRIEREYQLNGEGQLQTRVQAFIESIVNKQLTKQLAD
jgi:benzoyl-CoA reductase/2-hydroxyglutaryl-CoA dehydratase subunit BcrC/BadD/HgdB